MYSDHFQYSYVAVGGINIKVLYEGDSGNTL